MVRIFVNNLAFWIKKDISILEALSFLGLKIPRFCYHEALSVAGNCRICLVEVNFSLKPIASCAQPVLANIQIFTNTVKVQKARENVMETLLLNHPLDCPICDQAGECDLQDQSKLLGSVLSRYIFEKRVVENKIIDPCIKTIMTRCIHCTRCVRFASEIAGKAFLGTFSRGRGTEIGSYISYLYDHSEVSGNVIDLCPVGALTARPYAYKARPWELRTTETIDVTDGFGSNMYVNTKESEIISILPKNNVNINGLWLSNKARFYLDSIQKNRLFFSYINTGDNLIRVQSSEILNEINNNLVHEKKVFLVNEEIDFGVLKFLQRHTNRCFSKISIYNTSNFFKRSNFYYSNSNKISCLEQLNIRNIFLLATNINTESAILNVKLRIKIKNKRVFTFGVGLRHECPMNTKFINISILMFIKILEFKEIILSKILATDTENIFFIGEALLKRLYISKNSLVNFFRQFNFNNIVYILNIKVNSESIELLNIKSLNSRVIQNKRSIVFFCSLPDSLQVRNILMSLNAYKTICLNSHGSSLISFFSWAIPILTYFEQESIFINLEKRPQKTNKVLSGGSADTRPLISIVEMLNYNFKKYNSLFSPYIFLSELITNPKLFNNMKYKFRLLVEKIPNSMSTFNKLPFKVTISDYYLFNSHTRHSANMINYSIRRQINNNFLKTWTK